ncbi:hypothetical protein [Nocardia sp. NPDC058705]|uniref:hypothetical protein n=1 Tax=Nocardia sp. NPDC058705 TaxID=3346609 RepID=UPI00369D39B8
MDDPATVHAAFDRREARLGTAVIGLALNCEDRGAVVDVIVRAFRTGDSGLVEGAFVAMGHFFRLDREIPPALGLILRESCRADVVHWALSDAIVYIRFRQKPLWLKRITVQKWCHWHLVERWSDTFARLPWPQ